MRHRHSCNSLTGDLSSGNAFPENVLPENVSPGKASPGKAFPGKASAAIVSSEALSKVLALTIRSCPFWRLRFRKRGHRQPNRLNMRLVTISCAFVLMLPAVTASWLPNSLAQAQAQSGGAIQLKASRVEANSNTGIVTAVGNVRIDYPSRQIFATAAQAQYYSREQRIVLSGNVDVIQEGNTLQAETVTYLIEEGRFVATPGANSQVEAVYLLPNETALGAEGNTGSSSGDDDSLSAPPPPSLPAPPDELPADLSSLNVNN